MTGGRTNWEEHDLTGCGNTYKCMCYRGRAALQRRVERPESIPASAPVVVLFGHLGLFRKLSLVSPRRFPSPRILFSVTLLFTTACGYHTAGHAVQLPENVKTIAIPAFVNQTTSYRIEQMLTASVVREFTTRTRYRILNDPSEAADATLRGTVLSTSASPLTYDSATGRAASVLVVVSMKVSLRDRQGKVIYENPSYFFREQYEVSQDLTSFFEEDSPAFRRLSQNFARTLVSNILEGF